MHVPPAKVWLLDRKTHGQTDAGQSDPYVPLCFTGDTVTLVSTGPEKDHGYVCSVTLTLEKFVVNPLFPLYFPLTLRLVTLNDCLQCVHSSTSSSCCQRTSFSACRIFSSWICRDWESLTKSRWTASLLSRSICRDCTLFLYFRTSASDLVCVTIGKLKNFLSVMFLIFKTHLIQTIFFMKSLFHAHYARAATTIKNKSCPKGTNTPGSNTFKLSKFGLGFRLYHPKINRGPPIVMANTCVKYHCMSKGNGVIMQKPYLTMTF